MKCISDAYTNIKSSIYYKKITDVGFYSYCLRLLLSPASNMQASLSNRTGVHKKTSSVIKSEILMTEAEFLGKIYTPEEKVK